MASNAIIIGEINLAGAGKSQPRIWPRNIAAVSVIRLRSYKPPFVHPPNQRRLSPSPDTCCCQQASSQTIVATTSPRRSSSNNLGRRPEAD